jgi:hypothetical protein
MLWQNATAGALVLASAAFLVLRWRKKRREGAVCDRCAATAHLRMAKRPVLTPSGPMTRKK